jgi:uncharacterized protein (TIGR02145 family)
MRSRNLIRILFFCIIIVSIGGCTAEEIVLHGDISGIVTDAGTKQPLQTAKVTLGPTNETVTTGSDGKYLFKSLAPGNYQVHASKQNYAEGTNSATVTSASTTDIDFELDAIPALHYSETDLNFKFDLTSLSFSISKSGTGKVGYLCTPSQNWITVSPNSGDVDEETDVISVTVNRNGLNQKIIKERIVVRTTFNQYIFLDTITVTLWSHNPIVFNPGLTYGNVTDIEGNVYKTIQIGTQTWMAENLRATKYNDNTPIPHESEAGKWPILITPAYCWYDNNEYYRTDYGALYNWFAVSTGKLCPTGWHVPSADELRTLGTYLGGNDKAYVKLKEIGTYHWESPNEGATNESGFTALPAGYRYETDGSDADMGRAFGIWSSEQYNTVNSYFRQIVQLGGTNNYTNVTICPKQAGGSVRCIKD